MATLFEHRLMTKVSQMYYENNLHQKSIAEKLDISQATISRLLKRAQKEDIVRTTVRVPLGVYTELEEKLQDKYGLKQVIIADAINNSEGEVLRSIGSAAAYYLESTIKNGDVIGISSWSSTLMAMNSAMNQLHKVKDTRIIQILGSVGNPAAEVHASNLLKRLASLINGNPIFLPATAVADTISTKESYMRDQYVQEALAMFKKINITLVGIGAIEPSRLLASSGNIFSEDELKDLKTKGAVGDICLRFFNEYGQQVQSQLNERVIGMSLDSVKQIERSIGLAGGERKLKAIHGAIKGQYINILITDSFTAKRL